MSSSISRLFQTKKSPCVYKSIFFSIPPRGANQFQKPPPSLHSTRVYFNFVTPAPFPYFNEFQFCLHSQGELFFSIKLFLTRIGD